MRFKVLGPLEAAGRDGPIPLGGPRQRAVLAQLIVQANGLVPADTLIDQVWGEEPPAAARSTLFTYVSHLRKALGPDRIESRGPGYVLRIGDEELDSARFERLVQEGRLAGSPGRAREVLREALALWAGPAFADLATQPSLAAEIARLTELRYQALEGRIAADLAHGRHGEVIGELEALTRELPLRERLWELLMLALYRVGRPADALASFERAKDVLAEELGVDPSSDLRRMHERILREDPELDLAGEALRGYRLLEPIGEGAFGVVYRAIQPQVGREVAIKAVNPDLANHPDFVRRFEREAQIVARLEHPHIVPLYDYWREPDAAYLVMRFLRGGSVERLLDDGPLEPSRAAEILDHVAAALSAAHRQGVVHRDVKPGNILLDEEGNAYLTDFGVALDAGAPEKSSGTMMRGTPAYLSPEQIRLDPATPGSDIYALGIVAYEMLTREHPFPESSLTALLEAHLSRPMPSVRGARPELGPAVDDVIARATARDPSERFASVLDLAVAFREALEGARSAREPIAPTRNPYKGLRAFLEADVGDFFGREALTRRLVDRLAGTEAGSRFLAVVGPSGSGKSSVVRAGLVPAIRRGALPGSERWYVIDLLPGPHPLRELEAALLGVAVEPPPSLMEDLEADELGLVRSVERVLPDPESELVIVLDQLEEVFTLVEDEGERAHLLASLRSAAIEPGSRVRIVTTLRADFFDAPLSIRGFGELLAQRTEAITPMSAEELERAIVEPADHAGLVAEPMLVGAVIADVIARPGALPLLQYALTELAERPADGVLLLDAYRRIGGVSGALARRSEQLFGALNQEGRDACRQLFLRLVAVGEGGEETRRRVGRSELAALSDARTMDGVVDAFGRHRLLSFDRDPDTREPTVEIAHEALLGSWERLRGWIDDARDDIRSQRRLAAAASEWTLSARDPSFLLRGSRLEQAEEWAGSTTLALSADDRAYVDASARRRDEESAAEENRRVHERSLERRSVRRMRALVAVFALAAVVAASLTIVARDQGSRAEREARISRARELAAAALANLDADPELGILLAIEAVQTTRTTDGTVLREAEEALHRAVEASRVVMRFDVHPVAVEYSRDGSRVATAGTNAAASPGQPALEPQERGAIVWDATTGEQLLTLPHRTRVWDVEFSPDGSRMATSDEDGIVAIWDGETGEPLLTLHASRGETVPQIDFSPDGTMLATTDGYKIGPGPGTIQLWDARTGDLEREWSAPGAICGFAFSPNGRLVGGGRCNYPVEKTADVWDARTGERVLTLEGHADLVTDLVFSPDGSRIATASLDQTAKVWDARTGRELLTLRGHGGPLTGVAFDPEGELLATASFDGTVRTWDTATGEPVLVLSGHGGANSDVEFGPDGDHVVSGGSLGTLVWDVSASGTREQVTLANQGQGLTTSVAYSPDGSWLVTTNWLAPGGSAMLWDASSGRKLRTFPGAEASFDSAFGPDGSILVTGAFDGPTVLWDTGSGRIRGTLNAEGSWTHVAVSPDGTLIAVGLGPATFGVALVDATSGERIRLMRTTSESDDVEFSPDGTMLASASVEGPVTVWKVPSGEVLRTFTGHDGPVWGVRFAPDGTSLASSGLDGTARVWDIATGEEILSLVGHSGLVADVAFSPDGKLLATAGQDNTARLWDASTGRELLTLTGSTLGMSEVAFSPDGTRLAVSANDGTVRVYVLPVDELLDLARTRLTRGWTQAECRQYLHEESCPSG